MVGDRSVKVVVAGEVGVGKTALLDAWVVGDWQHSRRVKGAVGLDFARVSVDDPLDEGRGERVVVQLWDTAGAERFDSGMPRMYWREAGCVLLVFRADSRESFERVRRWLALARHVCPRVPCVLVCHHFCDPVGRRVSEQEATDFAESIDASLFEVDAKTAGIDMLDGIFREAAFLAVWSLPSAIRRAQARTLCTALVPRLGSSSPIALSCDYTLCHISRFLSPSPLMNAASSNTSVWSTCSLS